MIGYSLSHATRPQYGITCGRVAKAADQIEDIQVASAGLPSEFVDDSGRTVDSPMYVTGAAKPPTSPAPGIVEHSVQILSDIGVDVDTIETLQARGIIG